MSRSDGSGVIRLLMDMEILSKEDARSVRSAQSGALVKVLLEKRVIRPSEAAKAQGALEDLISSSNQVRRTQAQTRLYKLITSGLDHRIGDACDRMKEHKERAVARNWPAVAAKAKG